MSCLLPLLCCVLDLPAGLDDPRRRRPSEAGGATQQPLPPGCACRRCLPPLLHAECSRCLAVSAAAAAWLSRVNRYVDGVGEVGGGDGACRRVSF